MRARATPVAAWGRAHGLQVVTPERLRSEEGRAPLLAFRPDGLLLASYGQLVPPHLLALAPERAPLNVHPSLLPRHRGATPIPAAILAGDRETGVTLIVMTEKLDAGPMVARWRVPLSGDEDAPSLESALARLAAAAVPGALRAWAAGGLKMKAQDEAHATYSRAFRREDGRIDWTAAAETVDRMVRALQPWPGAWTTLDGRRLHVRRARAARGAGERPSHEPGSILTADAQVRVACGEGWIQLLVVQPEGRPPMPAEAWIRGLRRHPDEVLILGRSVDEA